MSASTFRHHSTSSKIAVVPVRMGLLRPTPAHSTHNNPSLRQVASSALPPNPGPIAAYATAAALLLTCYPAPVLAAGDPAGLAPTAPAVVVAPITPSWGAQQYQQLWLLGAAPAPAPAPEYFPPAAQQRRVFVSFARQVESLLDMGYTYVDVRSPEAYAAGHVPGSVNIPYSSQLAQAVEARFGRTEPIIIGCKAGNVSAQSMRLLTGFNAVEYRGGFDDWLAQGGAVAR